MNTTEFRRILSTTTFSHLRECSIAFDENQHFASAVWGAVFLEAFLGDLCAELSVPLGGLDDLNGRIQKLNQYQKNSSPQKPAIPDEIIKRCHDIRNTRNRLVHDSGLAKNTLKQDAQYIVGGLEVLLTWYARLKKDTGPTDSELTVAKLPDGGIRVFVSTISPHTQRQLLFIDLLLARIRSTGLAPIQHLPTIYDKKDPIGAVAKTIKTCQAMIVVGLERTHVYFSRDKEGAAEEQEDTHRRYTSGWLHLEAGLANALGMAVFVLCEKGICNDGIFDRDWNSYPVLELPTLNENTRELKEFFWQLAKWKDDFVQSRA